MRVTNSMMVSNYMNNLNTNMNKMSKISEQLATNRKYAHISDDPMSLIYSQQSRERLRKLSQYQSNVETAQSWLTQVETSVIDLEKIMASAYESCIDATTDVKSAADRANAAEYIRELRDQVLTQLNSTMGDKYLFGGYNTTGHIDADGNLMPPFSVEDETYIDENGLEQTRSLLLFNGLRVSNNDNPAEKAVLDKIMNDVLSFDVGLSVEMEVTLKPQNLLPLDSYPATEYTLKLDPITGDPIPLTDESGELLYDCNGNQLYEVEETKVNRETNLYELLDSLYREMANSDKAQYTDPMEANAVGALRDGQVSGAKVLMPFITRLQSAQSGLLATTATIGGRTQRLDLIWERYEQDEINYTQMKSDAEDMDQAEIIMKYKMAATVYDAALATGSYIIQNTLMNFLK